MKIIRSYAHAPCIDHAVDPHLSSLPTRHPKNYSRSQVTSGIIVATS